MASKFVLPALGLLCAGGLGLAAQQAQSSPVAPMSVRFTVPSVCSVTGASDRPSVHCAHQTPWHMRRVAGQAYWTVEF